MSLALIRPHAAQRLADAVKAKEADVITVGIDLAAQDHDTAVCHVEWQANRTAIVAMASKASDLDLLTLIPRADKVGIDIPLGWPDPVCRCYRPAQGW